MISAAKIAGGFLAGGIVVGTMWTGSTDLEATKSKVQEYVTQSEKVASSLITAKNELAQINVQLDSKTEAVKKLEATVARLNETIDIVLKDLNTERLAHLSTQNQVDKLSNDLKRAEATIEDLRNQLATSNTTNQELTAQLNEALKEIASLQEQVTSLSNSNNALTTELDKANAEVKEANEAAANHRSEIEEMLNVDKLTKALAE